MSTNKVFKLLVAKDVAVASATTLLPTTAVDGNVVAFRNDWTQLLAADTIGTAAASSSIFIEQRIVDSSNNQVGNLVSTEIVGTRVTAYSGRKFRPGTRQITYVGLHPAGSPQTYSTGTGSIIANSSSTYLLSVINKAEKEIRQVPRRYYFTTDASATQLEIANGFVTEITNDIYAFVTATAIGNGTGTNGLTGATAWGLKLKGTSSQYWFEVGLSDPWESTPITYDVNNFLGINTYDELIDFQLISQGDYGYYNRVLFSSAKNPLPSYVIAQPNSAVANSAGTVAVTQNSKEITFSANVTTELLVGDAIFISGVRYVIATITTPSTVYELTETYLGSTNAAITVSTGVTKEESYDTITIDHNTVYANGDTDGFSQRPQTTIIAIPSFLSQSTALSVLKTCLDAWMVSTPYKFPSCGL